MIYFDNAATTFPKPASVMAAVNAAVTRYGGNPGRSGHRLSMRAAEAVYSVREKAADMFGASPENVVFTSSCTHSLNIAVKGVLEKLLRERKEPHVIISSLEHNSVLRPVHELKKRGLSYSIAQVSSDGGAAVRNFESLMTSRTAAVVCTLGSNVTGQILPYREIGELCRRRGVCFIGDGAQACGVLPVRLDRDNINILCMPGHKGLYGLAGTGLLITDGRFPIYHLMEGGTGSTSLEAEQTPYMPEMLESGTLNTAGILSVGAGIDFVNAVGMERLHSHEEALCRRFISGLESIPRARVYRREGCGYLPIVLFNIDGYAPEETAEYLDRQGFALRGGLHCSGLAHGANGTLPLGGVRFAPSAFNRAEEVDGLLFALRSMEK